MQTDKKTVARRLIHNAIRQTFREEDPLVVHVISMCCYDLLREYAAVKGIDLRTNPLNRIPAEFLDDVINGVKLIFRFSKHARQDADLTIDETKIVPFADIMLVSVIGMYEECFGEKTAHMELFGAFALVRYPKLLSPVRREGLAVVAGALSKETRSESLLTLRHMLETRANLILETSIDLESLEAGKDFAELRE